MKPYFIVGTDTDCGKTYVTCELARFLQQQNQRVLSIKPIASGCYEESGVLVSDDVLRLERVNGGYPHTICPWRFKQPISPHLAAEADGQCIALQEVVTFCLNSQHNEYDVLLVEGAGGLMVPINTTETWVDFLKQSQMPVIIVVGIRLGCINHALLTALALKAHGIPCVGWIANCIDKNTLALDAVIETLVYMMDSPLLATVPYGGQLSEMSCFTC